MNFLHSLSFLSTLNVLTVIYLILLKKKEDFLVLMIIQTDLFSSIHFLVKFLILNDYSEKKL